MPLRCSWSPHFFLLLLLLRDHRRLSEHLLLINLNIQRLVVLLNPLNNGRALRPQTFGR